MLFLCRVGARPPQTFRNGNSAQRGSFGPDICADIRPKTSVRPSKSWKELRSKNFRADFLSLNFREHVQVSLRTVCSAVVSQTTDLLRLGFQHRTHKPQFSLVFWVYTAVFGLLPGHNFFQRRLSLSWVSAPAPYNNPIVTEVSASVLQCYSPLLRLRIGGQVEFALKVRDPCKVLLTDRNLSSAELQSGNQPQHWINYLDARMCEFLSSAGLGFGNLIGHHIGRVQFLSAPALHRNRSPSYRMEKQGRPRTQWISKQTRLWHPRQPSLRHLMATTRA